MRNIAIHLWTIAVFEMAFAPIAHSQTTGSITQGMGTVTIADMMPNCPSNHITPLGGIQSSDGKNWIVPSENHFYSASHLPDLYNSCNGITPANLSAVNLSSIPIIEIDPQCDTITAYLFCDNYFELYINDVLVGVDDIPFTPFNSSMVRFKVSRPYTIAARLVDWEEHLGIGSEIQSVTSQYHPGDGGFIAKFSDGTVTDTTWKAQSFYIAPLQNTNDIMELSNGIHSTVNATLTPTCNANCYGVHYDEPLDWTASSFNDTGWPNAFPYTAAQVTNQPAYVNFASTAWAGANFIWTQNLILDNVVLVRKTVPALTGIGSEAPDDDFQVSVNTNGFISIYGSSNSGIENISLVDLTGRKVAHWNDSVFNRDPIELELPKAIPFGNYFLQIRSESATKTFKILLGSH
jgi:hypothetical protein